MKQLFGYQEEVLRVTRNRDHVAYYLDMGLGKTLIGSRKLIELGEPLNLIVCQKAKIADWIEQLREDGFFTVDLTKSRDWNASDVRAYLDVQFPLALVINYELTWRRSWLLQLSGYTLLLDESSLIQNYKAKQSKFVLKLKPAHVVLLSGTPCSGKYENLWTQARLLGWNISWWDYNMRYVNYEDLRLGTRVVRIVARRNPYKNESELKNNLRIHGALFLKSEDVISLPEQTIIDVPVRKSALYREFIKNRFVVADDGRELVGDTALSRMTYARELCGSYSKEKQVALMTLLQSTGDRVVIFYNFDREREVIAEVCTKLDKPFSCVNGQTKEIVEFEQHDDGVLIVQYQAGAMGLNLQIASKVIFWSLPLRSDLYEQAKKRIHRIGQTKPCFYWNLICIGTVETSIERSLSRKEDYTTALFEEEKNGEKRTRSL